MNACNTVGRREDVMALHYISGFGDLAKFIASDHDGDTAIFRRFDILSARNLLYLQSELAELEYLQCQYDEEDARDGVQAGLSKPINLASRDWSSFNRGANDSNSPINERLKKRMDLVVAIREKLKEYRMLSQPREQPFHPANSIFSGEALVLESTILSMRRPSMQAHGAFNRQFWNERHGQRSFPALEGYGETLYEDRAQLVALKRADNEDRLTHILRRFCPMLFRVRTASLHQTMCEYAKQTARRPKYSEFRGGILFSSTDISRGKHRQCASGRRAIVRCDLQPLLCGSRSGEAGPHRSLHSCLCFECQCHVQRQESRGLRGFCGVCSRVGCFCEW